MQLNIHEIIAHFRVDFNNLQTKYEGCFNILSIFSRNQSMEDCSDDRIPLDIFKYETTYQNDYRRFLNASKSVNNYDERQSSEPRKPKTKEHIYHDNETFINWRKDVHIPFNLLWKRKDITNTNPYEPFKKPDIVENPHKIEAIKTRPRIYMSPAVSIDDVPDEEMRELLCQHMYTSDWQKASQESLQASTKKDVPNITAEPIADPVHLQIDFSPPLPNSFRNRGKKWEDSQKRVCVDPTAMFWTHKDPPVKCGACIDPVEGLVPNNVKEQITELINRDTLRTAHDVPIPGYAGYKPRLSYGVSLAKNDLPVAHPFLSTSQVITKRYAEEN